MTTSPVDIVRAIREAFDQLRFKYAAADRHQYVNGSRVWVPWQEDPLEGTTGWTKAINTTLCRIGQELGFETRVRKGKFDPAGGVCPGGELLWDIAWLRYNQDRMVDVPLVAESELNLKVAAIVEDFQKLLMADAGVRLMIIEHFTDAMLDDHGAPAENEHRAPAMANHLARHVQAFGRTQPGDVYLLAALDGHVPEGKEYHRMRYFRLGTDGTAVEWAEGEPSPFVANEP